MGCSDGLTSAVPTRVIRETLTAPGDPEQAVRRLIDLANAAGGPDNTARVVADVIAPGTWARLLRACARLHSASR